MQNILSDTYSFLDIAPVFGYVFPNKPRLRKAIGISVMAAFIVAYWTIGLALFRSQMISDMLHYQTLLIALTLVAYVVMYVRYRGLRSKVLPAGHGFLACLISLLLFRLCFEMFLRSVYIRIFLYFGDSEAPAPMLITMMIGFLVFIVIFASSYRAVPIVRDWCSPLVAGHTQ